MELSFNNGRRAGGRYPQLWIVAKGRIHEFAGETIPGVVVVLSEDYEKGGKWSNTTFSLELASSASAVTLLAELHGRVWPQATVAEAYSWFLGEAGQPVSLEEFERALKAHYPRAADRMAATEESLSVLDEDEPAEAVEITTFKPARRDPHHDVKVTSPGGESWVLAHEAPVGTEIPGVAKVVESRYRGGRCGGSTTLTLAVKADVRVELQFYPKDGEGDPNAVGRGA